MIWRRYTVIMTLLAFATISAISTRADAWESDMSIAGFSVTGVRGTEGSDGSGSAVGSLQLFGNQRISLTRSARGDIAGNVSLNARVAGAEIQGSFVLDTGGLRGRGTIKCSPKPVVDAVLVINPSSAITGSGRVELGRLNVDVRVSISGGSSSIEGSAPVKDQEETPLASYLFDGRLKLQGDCTRMNISASGSVRRTGKLANQVTQLNVSNIPINPADGTCRAVVDGVGVTFRFF